MRKLHRMMKKSCLLSGQQSHSVPQCSNFRSSQVNMRSYRLPAPKCTAFTSWDCTSILRKWTSSSTLNSLETKSSPTASKDHLSIHQRWKQTRWAKSSWHRTHSIVSLTKAQKNQWFLYKSKHFNKRVFSMRITLWGAPAANIGSSMTNSHRWMKARSFRVSKV